MAASIFSSDFAHFRKGVQPALGSSICPSVFIRFREDLIPKPRQDIEPFHEFAQLVSACVCEQSRQSSEVCGDTHEAIAHKTRRAGANPDSTRWEHQGRQDQR